ncbi:hypothetical protein GGS23DRAFT_581483 [Durotheca rogersii]|uniref:uncharacterized protein n=1 Tax=Durotheca rogersii TaxID=419775 RepID=UPI00221E8FA1|nr:uncharacterized protein GGS23DRAFT_581483 [Durotheca rogersii]KAI5860460.1 hypothetical protein GGS23DRAFT_581483 [Durotheca rogersii]
MEKFHVKKPFILFSRHHYMEGMTFLRDQQRFNEMVLYPQVQDALFFGEPFPIAQAVAKREQGEWKEGKWHRYLRELNIKVIAETMEDFKEHNEKVGNV